MRIPDEKIKWMYMMADGLDLLSGCYRPKMRINIMRGADLMLKNMKIKKSLFLGFAVAILLSASIIVVMLGMMYSQKTEYNRILQEEVRANELITTCRLNVNIAARNVRNIALVPTDPANAEMAQRAYEVLESLDDEIKTLREIYPLDDKENLEKYITALNEWSEVVPRIINAVEAGRVEDAVRLIQDECTPRLNNMISIAQLLDDELTTAQNTAVEEEALKVQIIIYTSVAALVLMIIVLVALASRIIRSVVTPVGQVHTALVGFSEGNLNIPVEYESKNELGEMCDAMRRCQNILSGVIEDTCDLLGQMADGDFSVHSRNRELYVGNLSSIIQSLAGIKRKLGTALTQINQSAEQVSSGAEQVSSGAQALSQGATEQASSVQELAATIEEISTQVNRNAEDAHRTSERATEVGMEVQRGHEQMQEMTAAMDEINDKSKEIAKIIKTIEDIAFQTNILALNAAVEAARAGAAGKGFAVVANEVRNLASKSADASKDTSTLIEGSVKAVEKGAHIAAETALTLDKVVDGAKEIVDTIDRIALASQQQADAVVQVTQGVDQISSVVQTNSATAEESAAASEELSGQANLLKELVGQFVLESDEETDQSTPAAYPVNNDSFDAFGSDKY